LTYRQRYYLANKEAAKAQSAKYAAANPQVMIAANRKHYLANRERLLEEQKSPAARLAQQAYRQSDKGIVVKKQEQVRDKEKIYARKQAQHAIRTGQLTRQPCEVCFTIANIHAHHDDYTKPLDVRWLCETHHNEHHRQEGV